MISFAGKGRKPTLQKREHGITMRLQSERCCFFMFLHAFLIQNLSISDRKFVTLPHQKITDTPDEYSPFDSYPDTSH